MRNRGITLQSYKEDIQRGYRSLELGEGHALKHAMILKMKSDEAKKSTHRS
ncbi:MAG TPA: hypothetical protein PLY93_06630 [Turneriella sp.]|nr:hypothetical protein [Turneriella sp.]